MKVCVLNGSPKGKYSITLQTMLYLEKKFDDCTFDVVHVGQSIRKIEKDMTDTLQKVENADLVLFSYPVYTFIAPYQLHRFIELLKESGVDLSGKYVAQYTTSKHFYDVTAHNYIKENCFDLGMKYVGGLSHDMEDLLKEKGQKEVCTFFEYVKYCIENDIYEKNTMLPAPAPFEYQKGYDVVEKKDGFDTVIVTNMQDEDSQLGDMMDDFLAVYPYKTKVINIAKFPFSGGCLGCFNCAADGKCIYKDGFDTFLREEIQSAKCIVYAFSIKDHSMGASFKLYDDRQFCNGHRTVTMGMPIGYIINGNLSAEQNLNTIITARADVGHNFLAGCATDFESVGTLSNKLCYALENNLVLPQSFFGVGGLKIFRDLIFVMRGLMKADHKFYKAKGFYDDMPQKQKGTIFKMKLVGSLMTNKKLKQKLGVKMINMMNEGMIAPYKKILDNIKSENS